MWWSMERVIRLGGDSGGMMMMVLGSASASGCGCGGGVDSGGG